MNLPNETQALSCTLPPPNELILKWAAEIPNSVYLKQSVNGQFIEWTYAEVADKALRFVTALRELGIKPGERVALISKNCAEWFVTDLALMLGDYVSVPIFPTAGDDTIDYCLKHSDAKAVIVGKLDSSDATNSALKSNPDLISIAYSYPSAPSAKYSFDQLIEQSSPSEERPKHHDEKIMSLVYTSGTSGKPKGAMLSYGAFSWSVQQLVNLISIQEDDRLFSYLPLAHITERVYVFGTSITGAVPTAFSESLDTFLDDVKRHQPTFFISVPRLWTVFQQRIQDKLPQRKLNILLKIPFVNRIIKNKIAEGLGLSHARILGCGSAPVSPALLKWYHSVGLNITEAWGMTESYAYSTINYPFNPEKIGTVGNAGPGVDIKIAPDGEILVLSKGLFSGYYQNDEATRESFNNEGWLHTGDIGSLDQDGYLTIQGRKKDTFKTAKGKFVSPVPIEKKLFEYSRVEMMCLIGLGLPAPILLVVPHQFKNFDRARYEKTTRKIINRMNAELESHEQIKGVLMIKDPWSIENGILTPTLKIKRHVLEQKYHQIGQEWPKGQLVVWED